MFPLGIHSDTIANLVPDMTTHLAAAAFLDGGEFSTLRTLCRTAARFTVKMSVNGLKSEFRAPPVTHARNLLGLEQTLKLSLGQAQAFDSLQEVFPSRLNIRRLLQELPGYPSR